MKKLTIYIIMLFVSGSQISCYKEPDLIGDITESLGKVAQISVVWLGTTRTTTSSSAVVTAQKVDAGATTNFNIEFTTTLPVKELRVYWAATASGTQTLIATITGETAVYDDILRSYKVAVPIQAQDSKGTTRVFIGEALTDNGLVSAQKSAVLTTNP